ncbi:uncharacterized protein si:dkey-93h22.7 isoform X2 [Astyanax mexicanus]|uniref:uncharacterized protein si:dkey-93h22.7 isoform X2 n=1 Tax=Astyanax mexicanus TaxID=7994 RepID=UPI0020CAB5D0|nr:uncharacterized protein si:dkey-93h22.7 isoform X2 [Astyanax mexicanus]
MSFPLELLLVLLGFSGMWQRTDGQTLGKPVLLGPPEAVLGTVEEFFCELDKVPGGLSVLYRLLKEGNFSKTFGHYSAHTGEPGKFPILVKHTHDGRFICEASAQNNTEVTPSFSDPKRFKVIEKAEAARITSEPDSEVFWEGESVTLQCSVISGTYLSYEWQLNDSLVVHRYNRSRGQLTIQRLSTSDSGVYSCSASNHFNGSLYSTSTTALVVRVKEQLSEPEISFQVIEDGKGIFSALVTCMSERGTPPVTIHLLKNNRSLAVEHGLRVVFSVPIHLNQDMGLVQCQATDGTRIMHSKPQNITVETVGGAVSMKIYRTVEHDFEIMSVWLQCSVERGTVPHYYWFLNNTLLKNPGLFHFVLRPDDSVIAFILDPQSTGIYHCESANAFNNVTRVQSPKRLISKEVMNKVPMIWVAVVFTCFAVLVVALTACCLYGLVLRRRTTDKYRDLKEDIMQMSYISDNIQYENEYDEEDGNADEMAEDLYEEDLDVVEASRIEDSDEGEEEDENSDDEQEEETEELGEEPEKQADDTKKQGEVPEIQKEETGQLGKEPTKQEEETGEQEEEPREQKEKPREQEEVTGEQEEETREQEERTEEQEEEQKKEPKEQEKEPRKKELTGEQDEETRESYDVPKEKKEEPREQEEEPKEQEEEPGEQEEEPKEQEEEPKEQVKGTGEQVDAAGEQVDAAREQEEEPKEREEEPGKQEEEPAVQEEEPGKQEEEPKEREEQPGKQEEEPKEQEEEPKEQEEEPGKPEEDPGEQKEEPGEQEEEPGEQDEEPEKQEDDPEEQEDEPFVQEEEPMETNGEQEVEPSVQEEEPMEINGEKEEDTGEQGEEPDQQEEESNVNDE